VLRLAAGDMVILTTDGLTEARRLNPVGSASSRVGPFFGMEGIAQLAVPTQSSINPLSQIGGAIFEGVRRFAGGSFHDDVCLLIGRREAR
jgi:serine phosphatase RsbU (regulator of sigma subunit)